MSFSNDTVCANCGSEYGNHYGRDCPDQDSIFSPASDEGNNYKSGLPEDVLRSMKKKQEESKMDSSDGFFKHLGAVAAQGVAQGAQERAHKIAMGLVNNTMKALGVPDEVLKNQALQHALEALGPAALLAATHFVPGLKNRPYLTKVIEIAGVRGISKATDALFGRAQQVMGPVLLGLTGMEDELRAIAESSGDVTTAAMVPVERAEEDEEAEDDGTQGSVET